MIYRLIERGWKLTDIKEYIKCSLEEMYVNMTGVGQMEEKYKYLFDLSIRNRDSY